MEKLKKNNNKICMVVIETNFSMKDGEIYDHQSRVIEVEDWEDYILTFTEYDGTPVDVFKTITHLIGYSIPKDVKISNLKYDEYHLSCDLIHKDGWIEKKVAYKSELIK